MIQAITFDFWDTLFVAGSARGLRLKLIRKALSRAGYVNISEAQIERAVGRAWREWDQVWEEERRTFGAPQWLSLLLTDLDANLTGSEREALATAIATSIKKVNPPLVDGIATVLPGLAERYRIGLICDTGLTPGRLLRELLETHGLLRHFAHLTFSDELGVSKPHPDAFLSTLAHLETPPQAAVHIGDYLRTDIAGARAVGMRAIRFYGCHDRPDGAIRADAEIASYDELEPLLEQWDR